MTDGTPGWFRDPTDASLARWHDGERWTEHTLVIADQTPGVEPEPPDMGDATIATPIVSSEPEFHIPRPARGMGRAGGGSWPTWAKVGAPVAVLVLALGAWVATSGGDDDPEDNTETVDALPVSLEDAVDAARQAGLPDAVTDSRAATLIERICGAATRAAAKDQLGEDLATQIPAESEADMRRSVGALGVGAQLRCSDELEANDALIDDLQDLAVAAMAATTTTPTVVADGGTDAVLEAAGTDGGGGDGTDGGTTRTTRRSSTATTAKPTTTTTAKPLPQVLPNTACSSEGAKAQNKITGAGLTCMKKCNSSGLQWRSGPCPTTPTAPPTTAGPAPTAPTTPTTSGGTTGGTGGPVTGGTT